MKKEEHKALLSKLNAKDLSDADRTKILIDLERDYSNILQQNADATKKVNDVTEECNKYAKLNNELWLANSSQKHDTETPESGNGEGVEEQPPKRTYEDLEKKFEEE